MPSTNSLLERLKKDYPALQFTASDNFEWDAAEKRILFDPSNELAAERLLHEVGHAQLAHETFQKDVELIALERSAWELAKTLLGPRYSVQFSADVIEDDLDTYRDWLHARSSCPNCDATGLQTRKHTYRCVACSHTWKVNDARSCGLKRYSI